MQAYQSMLEILGGLALLLISARAWFFTLIAEIAIIYGIVVWIIDPLANSPHVSALPVIILCAIGLIIYRWFCRHTPPQSTTDDTPDQDSLVR
jgi:lipoprotein signal peptidase